jgi:hypothetical protein
MVRLLHAGFIVLALQLFASPFLGAEGMIAVAIGAAILAATFGALELANAGGTRILAGKAFAVNLDETLLARQSRYEAKLKSFQLFGVAGLALCTLPAVMFLSDRYTPAAVILVIVLGVAEIILNRRKYQEHDPSGLGAWVAICTAPCLIGTLFVLADIAGFSWSWFAPSQETSCQLDKVILGQDCSANP